MMIAEQHRANRDAASVRIMTKSKGLVAVNAARGEWMSWRDWIVYTLVTHRNEVVDREAEAKWFERRRAAGEDIPVHIPRGRVKQA